MASTARRHGERVQDDAIHGVVERGSVDSQHMANESSLLVGDRERFGVDTSIGLRIFNSHH